MPVLENLRSILPELSKNERKAADYMLKYPQDIQRRSGEALAADAGTSRSAIIRLCQKLGYQGFAEFKYAVIHEPSSATGAEPTALDRYESAIQQLRATIKPDILSALGRRIVQSNRVLTLGNYHSGMSAQQLAFRLNRSGIDSHAITDLTQMESYEFFVKENDVILIFSLSGAELYEDMVVQYRKRHAHVVLLTMTPRSPLTKMVDETIALPYVSHEPSSYLMDDAITFFLMIELVIEAVQKELAAKESEG